MVSPHQISLERESDDHADPWRRIGSEPSSRLQLSSEPPAGARGCVCLLELVPLRVSLVLMCFSFFVLKETQRTTTISGLRFLKQDTPSISAPIEGSRSSGNQR